MIAPNGKQSNLTDSQYKLVRTPAFKQWFGDWEFNPSEASKVVDENGEPLVVYHGTNAEFNVFNKKGKGNRVLGYFFTTEKDFSENYGKSKLYFLNIKNIKNFNAQRFDSLNTRQNAENNYWELEKDKLLAEMYNGVLIDRNDLFADINFARKDYVAFEPSQIKLADGSNTTFDSNNNDIRFDEGGNVNNNFPIVKLKIYANNQSYNNKRFENEAFYDFFNEKIKFVNLDTFGDDYRFNWLKVKENSKGFYIEFEYYGGRIYIENYLNLYNQEKNKEKYKQGGNIKFKNNNMSKHNDGLFVGKSHKEGGIPIVVKSTGQRIEVEGGESITNKTSMADTKRRTLTGTNCEIISQINTQNGNGVAMDCDSVVGKKYKYEAGGQVSLFDGQEDFFGKKRFADGGSVSAKEIEEWRKYVLSNSSWFDNESDDSVEITLTTRENGDTYNEQAGQKDIDEAKNIYKKIISKFPKTQGKIERVDEYVYLHLKPSKSTEELEEEKRIETTQNQEKNSAKIISEKLNFSKEKAFDVVERLRYSKQYYEQYKNEKADRYNNSFRVYFQQGTPSNIKFNNAEEVFDYITKDDFIKSIYNRSNPRNKVQIGLYGWDSLLIKYDNDGFGVLENGKTDWSKRTKILQIFPYIESNIQNQEDFINKVKKAISEFILCYKIYVLNDYQEEKKVIVKPKKDLKTQKQVKDFLSNFSIIDKKIMGLRLALRVANKEDEKLIERRIKALEIANKTQVYADLNENEIKVLKAISISSKANGGDFTYFEYVMEEIKDLTQQQVKGYISQLKQKEYISVSEDEFSQIYAGKYHEYLTHYKFNN